MQATIQNEFLSLTVDTHGAEAVSLKNAAGEELLWQADPAVWERHAPILFPWTGKLKDGSFTHGGKTYKGGQHGFARDVEHTLLKAEGDTIRLELRPDEAMKAEKFPFDFLLISTFRLDGKTLHHTLTVSNPGTEELRFGIGYHPAFQVPFDDSHTVEDYEFRFDRPESPVILDASGGGLLTGKCYYQWKNQQAIQLTNDLFDNDSFCMAGLRTRTLGIYEKDTGRSIVCDVPASPTPSSGRRCRSPCASSASSRGTRCPPRWTIRRSGASGPLRPVSPPAGSGARHSARPSTAEPQAKREAPRRGVSLFLCDKIYRALMAVLMRWAATLVFSASPKAVRRK